VNLKSHIVPTFCPGCHNFILYSALQQAIIELKLDVNQLVLVFDIGCVGNMADFFKANIIHSLHGRCLPTAVGVKLANPKLTVLAIGGDGGIYGEGMNHLITAARANYSVTTIVANNQLYSLTTGQTSPTTPQHAKTKSTPLGSISLPVKPVSLLRGLNPEVLVESVDGVSLPQLVSSLKKSILHSGFSLLDLGQVCASFGKQLS